MAVRLSSDAFQQLVADALESLPQEVHDILDNVDVQTQLWPSVDQLDETGTEDGYGLLGLYEGISLAERGIYNWALPDRVTLFQRPLEAICDTPDELAREVKVTVIHELAHHVGWSDEDIHRMGFG
jgi:predicted Zn-dependent protease with MMP-like domain